MEANYLNYIIPSITVIFIILLIFYYFHNRKRSAEITRIVASIGLKQISKRQFYKYIDKKEFSLLSPKIAPVYISEAYQGHYNNYDVCVFQVGLPSGGSSARHYTAVHVKADSIHFPKLIVNPKDIGNKIAGLFGIKGIEVSYNPEFSKQYNLSGESESRVRSLFQPNIIHFFEQHEGLTFEANGNEFIVFKDFDSAKHEQYSQYIERALGFIDLFKKGHVELHLIQQIDDEASQQKKANKFMIAAIANLFVTAIIIGMIYYFVESSKSHIFSKIILIVESLIILYYAWQKKKHAESRSKTIIQ